MLGGLWDGPCWVSSVWLSFCSVLSEVFYSFLLLGFVLSCFLIIIDVQRVIIIIIINFNWVVSRWRYKQVRKHIHKRNNTKHSKRSILPEVTHITEPAHTYPHITKTHTYTYPHITKQFKTTTVQVTTTTVQDIPNWNSHRINKYPKYKYTLKYMALLSSRTSP
jgi:hypothetical protein